MNSIFSDNFNYSTPLRENNKKFLFERNHDEEYYMKFRGIEESTSKTQERSLTNELHSRFSSIENIRKEYARSDEKDDSFLNVQSSYVTSTLFSVIHTKQDSNQLPINQESDLKTVSSSSGSIIDGDDHLESMISMEEKEVSKVNNDSVANDLDACRIFDDAMKLNYSFYTTRDVVDIELMSYKSSDEDDYFNKLEHYQQPSDMMSYLDKVGDWINFKGYMHYNRENISMSHDTKDCHDQDAMSDESQIIDDDDNDEDIYLDNINTNIYSSYKDELIRKYRKRQQKIIIDDEEEAGMSLRRMYTSNMDVMYDDSTCKERSLYRTMNTSRNERKETLVKENEELSEFLENYSVSEQDFITIMKILANNKREINQINLEEERKYDIREGRVSLNESVLQRRTRELLKENSMLRRAVTINEITKELTAEDWMLLKDAVENNDRELNDMMNIMEDLADKSVMLETETARMTKIVVNVAEVLADVYRRQSL